MASQVEKLSLAPEKLACANQYPRYPQSYALFWNIRQPSVAAMRHSPLGPTLAPLIHSRAFPLATAALHSGTALAQNQLLAVTQSCIICEGDSKCLHVCDRSWQQLKLEKVRQ